MLFLRLTVALAAVSSVFSHPLHHRRRGEYRIINRTQSTIYKREERDTRNILQLLSDGNKAFRDSLAINNPTLLRNLTDEGQSPPFMFLGCSDSRVSEGTIFNATPGTFFAQRNIANQFHGTDTNAQSVLAYAVAELGVQHIIVMGHYGCGGVAASIASPPAAQVDAANAAVQNWIAPVRQILQTSTRAEIVDLRERLKGQDVVEEPNIQDPGFRALVEENVEAGVANIVSSSVISNHFSQLSSSLANRTVEKREKHGSPANVFVHGFVYDIETGVISDLGVSVGPPGVEIPPIPFSAVVKAAESTDSLHSSSEDISGAVNLSTSSSSESNIQVGSVGATIVDVVYKRGPGCHGAL